MPNRPAFLYFLYFLQPIKIPFSSFDPGSLLRSWLPRCLSQRCKLAKKPLEYDKTPAKQNMDHRILGLSCECRLIRRVYKIREGFSTSVAKAIYYLRVVESVCFAVIIRLSRSGPSALENLANKHYKQELTSKSARSPGRCRRQKYWIKKK